ncbi:MAG: hypothetical protein ABJA81_02675 [Nocardioidaceae bacterium]
MNRWISSAALVALTLGITGTALVPAVANANDVVRRGSCSGSTDWKLKASPDNGRIEVEGEGDSKGVDTIGWRARNPANGEVCRGSLRF